MSSWLSHLIEDSVNNLRVFNLMLYCFFSFLNSPRTDPSLKPYETCGLSVESVGRENVGKGYEVRLGMSL